MIIQQQIHMNHVIMIIHWNWFLSSSNKVLTEFCQGVGGDRWNKQQKQTDTQHSHKPNNLQVHKCMPPWKKDRKRKTINRGQQQKADEEDKDKNGISKNKAAEINWADTVFDPPETASLRCD